MSIKAGQYAVSNFHIEVDGQSGGYLSSFQAPSYEVEDISQALGPDYITKKMMGNAKIGEATAVFNISQAGSLLAWVETVWNKQCVEKDTVVQLANQDYEIKRGINMNACVITGIELPELKASEGKKHLEVTAKWQAQNLKYLGGGGKAQGVMGQKAKAWLTSNFEVHPVMGLKTEWITSIGLPKITPKIAKESHGKFRLPLLNYASIEFATIKVEIGAAGYKTAEDLAVRILQDGHCEESEFQDILIDMKDQSLKTTLGTFTLIGCGLKKFDWAPKLEGGKEGLATATMEFMVEDFRFKVDHK
ncbi:MAG TPA: phage tail protein [Kofleriaceae bacterium]|nr:phage tail protein [Kofleriaceae bacterium]